MTFLTDIISLVFAGLLAVTAIDTLGSITSRKWNYNYAYLSPVSITAYTLLGYIGNGLLDNFMAVLFASAMVGIYDGTIGYRIAILLRANYGEYAERAGQMSLKDRIIACLGISGLFGFFGYYLAGM